MFAYFSQELVDFRGEDRQKLVDGSPEPAIIDHIVTVDENVPQADNLPAGADPGGDGWVVPAQAIHRFTDDLKIALNQLMRTPVVDERIEGYTFRVREDELRCIADIF